MGIRKKRRICIWLICPGAAETPLRRNSWGAHSAWAKFSRTLYRCCVNKHRIKGKIWPCLPKQNRQVVCTISIRRPLKTAVVIVRDIVTKRRALSYLSCRITRRAAGCAGIFDEHAGLELGWDGSLKESAFSTDVHVRRLLRTRSTWRSNIRRTR